MANLISFLSGLGPTLIWLWFWLQEDKKHPEPKRKIFLSFLGGMLAVILVLPIERFIYEISGSRIDIFTLGLWAATEELLKFGAAFLFAIMLNKDNDEPIDSVIYLISAALGFSALENAFFISNLIEPGLITQSIISGNMRFIGATVLHTASSAIIGVFMAFGFYKSKEIRRKCLCFGILGAIALHTIFNSLIIREKENLFFIFGGVWLVIISIILIIEKIKTINK